MLGRCNTRKTIQEWRQMCNGQCLRYNSSFCAWSWKRSCGPTIQINRWCWCVHWLVRWQPGSVECMLCRSCVFGAGNQKAGQWASVDQPKRVGIWPSVKQSYLKNCQRGSTETSSSNTGGDGSTLALIIGLGGTSSLENRERNSRVARRVEGWGKTGRRNAADGGPVPF